MGLLARHVQDRVGLARILVEDFHRLGGGKNEEFYSPSFCFEPDVFHHGHGSVRARPDHQSSALPRDLLPHRERRVPELIAKRLGRLLFSLANPSAGDHHVVLIRDAVNSN